MATAVPITKRVGLGRNLTAPEVDTNFQGVVDALAALSDTVAGIVVTGGGITTLAAASDKTTIDLPTVNTPLATALATKAGAAATTAALATKADDAATTTALAGKASTASVAAKADDAATTTALAGKASVASVTAKADDAATTAALALKASTAALATTNAAVALKVNSVTAGTNVTNTGTATDPILNAPSAAATTYSGLTDKTTVDLPAINGPLNTALAAKQASLVSGTSLKTVGGVSLLGAGDVPGGGITTVAAATDKATIDLPTVNTPLATALAGKQASLVSGTSIKTVGGTSLLGAGDVALPVIQVGALAASATAAPNATAVQNAIAALVASSPAALDTLNELALALGSDPNFATTMTTALGLKAPLASPTFTGVPAAPTAAAATSTTQLATTAFATAADNLKANAASPATSGTATGTMAMPATWTMTATPSQADNSTKIATTAYVDTLGATKVTDNAAVDLGATTVLTTAAHSNRHLYSATNLTRSLPSSGQGVGHFIEYTNKGAIRDFFTGGFAAPGMVMYADPGETVQFVYSTQWDSVTPANPSSVPSLAGDSKSVNYTTVLSDAGKRIRHPAGDANARTFTIDGTVAYPDGTVMTFPNRTSQVLSVALVGGAGTLRLAGSATTGTRAVAQHGYLVAMLDGGDWLASGPGVT